MSHPIVQLETDQLPSGPWIYARQVRPAQEVPDGALVEVVDASERFVGHGLFNGQSDIRVRLLSRGRRSDLARPRDFLLRKLAAADRLRRKTLRLQEVSDAYRVVHAEGDDLSGLIVDRLGDAIVCEHHARGFWLLREDVEWALTQLYPDCAILHRVPTAAGRREGFEPDEEPPDIGEVAITEHGARHLLRPGQGHKTGWFCDQRDNRQRVAALASGRNVLDLCCNAGGFAVAAALGGARSVRAFDLDEGVLEAARRAARDNGVGERVSVEHADAFDVLRAVREEARRPDVVVLDPPKLAAGKGQLEEARRKYLDLNALGLEATGPGGIVATFSCSGALDLPGFLGICFQAARRAGRGVRLLEVLGAGPDHPQRPDFARSRYLKGALFAVDGD